MTIPIFQKPLSSLTDEELMQRVSSKDDDRAYSELYHRHARRLMGFFFRQMNGDEALAADLTQDAFLRVWTARDRFSGTSFRTWLLTIGYNLVKNHFRHSGHQREYEQLLVQTEQEETDNSIMEKMEKDAFDQALRQLLEKMPPESLAISTAKRYLHYGNTQTMQQLFNKLDEQTPEQLHQTAQEVFTPQNLHTLIYK